tara:strand:+ start:499 stop:1095 length:597 start_codon:yes stop_codon:yes gene_type:complete
MINLHLGCGDLKLDNFINIDILSNFADMKLDITDLSVFNNSTVDQIYSCHALEHIKRNKILNIILEWNRVLKHNGILRICVPDFQKVAKIYNKNKKIEEIIGFLNGGQKDDYDIHYVNFDIDILSEILKICGFDNISKYDAHEFLGDKDDYSKAYLPHMDIENGELMSLNIVCYKNKNVNLDNVQLTERIKKYLKINN